MSDSATRPRQLPLDLPWPRHDGASRGDFIVSDSNRAAVTLLDAPSEWPDGRLALVGPEGSGKTHLALIWAQETGARFVDGGASDAEDAARDWAASGYVVFEDCDRRLTTPEAERALFHLLNILREEGGRILMTGRTPPSRWAGGLPDLASRLSAVTAAPIAPPDEELLEQLVVKLLRDRHIVIKDRLASYIARRIDRSSAAVEAAVARLDARSLELGQPVSVKLAKDLFGW